MQYLSQQTRRSNPPTTTDRRYSFLCTAASHYRMVRDGHAPLDVSFVAVTKVFDKFFPSADPECSTCGMAPCLSPSFCAACRRADAKRRWGR